MQGAVGFELADAALFSRAQSGEGEALVALLKRHEPRLLRMIQSQLHSSLRARVEPRDVLQEVAVAALQGLRNARWTEPDAMFAWLSAITRHKVVALARRARAKTRPRRSASLPDAMLVHVPDDELVRLAGSATARPDDPPAWSRAIGRTRGEERMVLLLRERFGVPWPTLAFILDRRADAVRMLHLRATRRMRRALD